MKPQISSDQPVPETVKDRMDWSFLEGLEVGQSAHFDDIDDEDQLLRLRNNLSSAAHRYGERLDKSFTVHLHEDRRGVGVWRTK